MILQYSRCVFPWPGILVHSKFGHCNVQPWGQRGNYDWSRYGNGLQSKRYSCLGTNLSIGHQPLGFLKRFNCLFCARAKVAIDLQSGAGHHKGIEQQLQLANLVSLVIEFNNGHGLFLSIATLLFTDISLHEAPIL